ncbi:MULTISPECIES: aminotransferase class V-fold PLP-dependent enzyme [unclassified Fibrobacter]|uniref:aminotransferase class V-fold PLP-dependent enzyme n=1 Tax=unclassified Fibrobacter TaxID=2634177 RepID=UPI00091304CF|nr:MULTISPECIES: SufS family cysteine desulfurase [Fibrobacter]MCL4102588.1 Cysteine desulfurase [Fibrobacter succinogenes]OWV03402.1 cysteine sulfinate desulfinase [Fibrobacter sp. UWH3]SHK41854.1 cysteine desulfurase / selenocysteine lyase [Fibrobacter sp. UWH6]
MIDVKFDAEKIRSEFPMLVAGDKEAKPLAFLDSTATTQKPACVIDVMNDFYREHYSSVKRGVYRLSARTTEAYEATRKNIAKFINAKSENEIVFTRGTTESINLVAWSYGRKFFNESDEVLISGLEHHANIVSWQIVAEMKGAKIKVIPVKDDGDLDLGKLPELLTEKVKMVAVTHVSNAVGTVNPIKEIIKTVRSNAPQAKILIDCAQSSSHLKIDVQELDCDFIAFSGHKMYGPTGIGVLYGKYDVLDSMPPWHGGGEMIKNVTFEKTTYADVPERFEAGTPAIAEVLGLGKAVEWIQEIGLDNIREHEEKIVAYALEQLATIPQIKVLGNPKNRGALISVTLDGIAVSDAAMILDEENVAVRSGHHCAQPVMDRFGVDATLRLSFGVYTLERDVDRFIAGIKRVIRLFA